MIAEKNNLARKQLEEIERLQLHLIELEAALERKNEEIEEIAASMHERAERYLAQEGELRQELEDQRMALTQEAAAYRAQLDTKVQELAASHEKSLADLTSALKEQRAMISTLQASLREAQGNQEITRAQLEASEDEHAKLKATLRRKEADLAALREQYEDLSSNGDPNAWEKLVMETAEHSEILRQKHDLISKLEALEEERESNEVLLREAASRESAAKATAAAAAKELAQAHEIQKALEAQVALLEEKGEEEAFLVAQLQIAERRATKAEGELRDLMDAIKAANGKDPSGLIQLIFDQYQAFRTGKESKAA